MDELLLTNSDAQNFVALVNCIYNKKVRNGSRSTNHTITGSRKLKLLHEQNFECYDCFNQFQPKNGSYSCATTEHVIPYRYGSACNKHNIILLCSHCNNKRNKKNTEQLIELIESHFGSIDWSLIPDKPIPFIRVK